MNGRINYVILDPESMMLHYKKWKSNSISLNRWPGNHTLPPEGLDTLKYISKFDS